MAQPVPDSPSPVADPLVPARPALRAGYRAAGFLFLALGAVGALVPLLPTTVFWILAVVCLMRAGDPLAQALLAHRRFGPGLRLFLEHGAITRQGKVLALSGLLVSAAGMGAFAPSRPIAAGIAMGALALAVLWIATRPEPRPALLRAVRPPRG
ncbi:YbaN family protein [Arenibaculum pallidiluteum]|uniref:YbaN family protein n=1 Tax=Arenibaculum pallidiluteum TaxID=2812559 RepID=UPI001A95B593|nr:YbaN family protein [Arenibaculum pallidiluteum]